MQLFAEIRLSDYTGRQYAAMIQEIESENRHRLLNLNEVQYIDYLVNRYKIEPLVIDFDDWHGANDEVESISTFTGNIIKRQILKIHLPFHGDKKLLQCLPNEYTLWNENVELVGNEITFVMHISDYNQDDGGESIKAELNNITKKIKTTYERVSSEVEAFNRNLESYATAGFHKRKQQILKQENLLASIGVPVKRSDNIPQSFAVPVVTRNVIIKPNAPTTTYEPEPVLDEHIYQEILNVIGEFGKAMERQPSTYQDKQEEPLRDLFLMLLTPHFKSTTGETFNKKGKTDILIRHENNNVFVAECKVWKGIEGYLRTIDQLLSYLTWRDTKAAILMFVQNKQITNVLQQVKEDTAQHPCFVKSKGSPSEARFDFAFHLPGDESRGVQLAVFCFHFA